jgi:hypothetical protein
VQKKNYLKVYQKRRLADESTGIFFIDIFTFHSFPRNFLNSVGWEVFGTEFLACYHDIMITLPRYGQLNKVLRKYENVFMVK